MMKLRTWRQRWKESFFRVDQWGRSSFRLLLIGLCFLAAWRVSALVEMPIGLFKAIHAFGVLGIIFVVLAGFGPTLELVICAISERKRHCQPPTAG
jgi:hypothetical protein